MLVPQRIERSADTMTVAERKLAAVILADYPFAGLKAIKELADSAHTSSPTVSRFVAKLGFSGYAAFQQALIGELKDGQKSPVQLMETQRPFREAWFSDFMARAEALMVEVREAVSDSQFDRICAMLSERGPAIYLIGGRISDALAQYLARHLRQFRTEVYHLPSDPESWPAYVLRMRKKDILLVVDFRRYQPNLARLAQVAVRESGARLILVTDKWISPVASHATEVLAVPVDNGTLWDSYSGALSVIEAIMTRIAGADLPEARKRIDTWDRVRKIMAEPGTSEPGREV